MYQLIQRIPSDRIEFIEKDSNCKIVIDEEELERFNAVADTYSTSNIEQQIGSSNLAYVIYTSGSTGKPKGAMIEHKNVVRLFFTEAPLFDFKETDVWTMFHSHSFDFSVWEIYGAILYGGKVIVIPKSIAQDTQKYIDLVEGEGVTVLNQTPSAFYNFIDLESQGTERSFQLRYIVFGGEALSPGKLSNWYERYPEAKLINMYGITETTVHVTYKEIGAEEISNEKSNIGFPIPTLSCLILDNNQQMVPVGVVGELYVSGAGLARGYLNRAELTAERFIKNPYDSASKMYKTGDLGRWLPDGNMEYMGRSDDQVKIRGHRIELGEIENSLSVIEGISQSVVEVKEKESGKYLVAYYVGSEGLEKSKIKEELNKLIPDYMVPNYYVELETIPLTTNGKVNRKSLPEVGESDLIKTEYIAPRNKEESILAAVWSEVLKYENIGVKDNFYNLGGDSIKSILVISRLKQQGYKLKVEQLLKHPILEDLAKLLELNDVEVDQSEVEGEVNLTPIQRYFFEQENFANKNYYNQSILLKSNEELDGSLVESCIKMIVRHHDGLRMIYTKRGDEWSQYNGKSTGKEYKYSYYDLREETDEQEALNRIGESLQSSIDIGSGVLFHIGHFRMTDGDRLGLILHHLVVDGVSWRIMLEDFTSLYESKERGEKGVLPLKTDSYKRWASSLTDYAKSAEMQTERAYWENVSEKAVQPLPVDFKSSEEVHLLDDSIDFQLSKELTEQLKTSVHGVYNTEVNDVLLTSLGLGIKETFGVEQSVISMEGHGREEIIDGVDVGRTVGWFTSIFPFVLDVSDSEGNELVKVKESLRAIPKRGVGFGILNYLDRKFEKIQTPEILFNYLGDFGDNVGGGKGNPKFEISNERLGATSAKLNSGEKINLDILGVIGPNGLNISIRYSSKSYTKETIENLSDSYKSFLENLISSLASNNNQYLTPSDLTYKDLSFDKLFELNKNNTIEDIYELAPLQQGMYYHWQVDNFSPMYFEQFCYKLHLKNLDIGLVEEAFNKLIDRYSILRTSFNGNLGEVPLQVVYKTVKGDFSVEKLSGEEEGSNAMVDAIMSNDRGLGFDLSKPSLMRLKVIEMGNDKFTFIWSHHHILMDGWCISILVNDFYRILLALDNNQDLGLVEPVKYSTYIDWLSKIDNQSSLKFWNEYLSGLEEITDVPFKKDTLISNNQKSIFKIEKLSVTGDSFDAANAFNKELGITWSTFVQGVWAYLLSAYNNTKDVVFGSIVSGRPAELLGVEEMIGLFINTIPVRVQYNDKDTPITFLKRLHAELLNGTSHHYASLSDVQSQSYLGMDLIKTIVVVENFLVQDAIETEVGKSSSEGEANQGIVIEEVSVFEQTNYDFNVIVAPTSDSLNIEFKYNPDVFETDRIQNIVAHFTNLIEQFSAQKDALMKELDYLTSSERSEILNEFNKPYADYPKEKTIVDLFEEQSNRTPSNIAVAYEGKELSYESLNAKANQLGRYLRDKYDIQPDDLVGLKLERSDEVVSTQMGILKSGGAYVPIDPAYPSDRIEFIEKDSNCKIVIDEEELERFNAVADTYSTSNIEQQIGSSNLAYVIYTSGSTGKPKGAMIEHKNVVRLFFTEAPLFDFKETDVWTMFHSHSFDFSVWEIYGAILYGGKVIVIPKSIAQDTQKYIDLVEGEGVTVLNQTPSAFYNFIDLESQGTERSFQLRYIVFGGEALSPGKLSNWYERYPEAKLINMYGITETTVHVTYKEIGAEEISNEKSNIGFPIPTLSCLILDNNQQMVPVGVVGELYVSGAGLARGYLNRAELTAERFIKNPYDSASKMYKTGDLGRWLPDGNMEYMGRSEDQVKIRGHRIELGEIENSLSVIEGISQSVVEVKEKESGKYLVAYYVGSEGLEKSKIKEELNKLIPDYMVPNYYVELETIPLTTNGKVNRKSLPEVGESDLIKTEYIAPRNKEESILAAVWSEVLKYENIGVKDNFYNLGAIQSSRY